MKQKCGEAPLQVVVASYDANWLRVTGNYLAEQTEIARVDCYGKGQLLLAALKDGLSAQILILDEQLQDMDLLSFMQGYAALRLKKKPVVLGLCSKKYLGYTGKLISLGMSDFMAKPLRMRELYQRLLHLYRAHGGGEVREYCKVLYHDWGLDFSSGSIYLMDAVRFASDSIEKLAVRKELLWNVAVLHNTSESAVDASLRRLINKLDAKAAPAYLAFKAEAGYSEQEISVGALIYAMKEYIAQQEAKQYA